jgi:two-component system chemotaxis response regulator CheB
LTSESHPPVVTRLLVVDDSVLVRRTLSRAFAGDPALEVVGATRNGPAVLAKADAVRPDVVVLDAEVSGTDGFATLAELRTRRPELRVVIFSPEAAPATGIVRLPLRAATSFAFKPRVDGIGLSEDQARAELLPALRQLGVPTEPAREHGLAPSPRPERNGGFAVRPAAVLPTTLTRSRGVTAIVVAVSTGGPDALEAMLSSLPVELPVPMLVVQHMPPTFTRMLAERLDRSSPMPVVEASAGAEVLAGRVYLAPGGRHLALVRAGARVEVVLHDGPRENSCRPAADVLFRAAAEVYGADLLAVVLTGMGSDGLRGAEAVRDAGGSVIAQSEDTATIPSMPGAVAAAGLADAVVRLEDLGVALSRASGSD